MQFSYIAVLIFVLAVVSAAPTQEQKEERKKAHEKCQADPATHIDDSVFEKLKNGEKPDDPKLPKHNLCININLGIQNENGDINADKLRKDLEVVVDDKDKVNEIVTKCGTRGPGTAEEAATALMKCLFSHGHGHGHGPHGQGHHHH